MMLPEIDLYKKRKACVYRLSRICRHASSRRSSDHAAFAGEVEGSGMASIPVCGLQYFIYKRWDVFPLQYICLISALFRIGRKSLATTFVIELSDDPVMSQDAIVSHNAI